jgi:putative FmdB family regulatory protein
MPPVYDYECDAGHTFDIEQGMKDAPLTTCIVCGATAKRLISPSTFILKGTGWTGKGGV